MSPTKHYYIEFNTKEFPGAICATRVVLDQELVRQGEVKQMRVDLCDHPLYAKLFAYVMANPPRKKK